MQLSIPKLPTIESNKYTKLFVIGNNDCGELGLGENETDVKFPRQVNNLVDHIVQFCCGSQHVAALNKDGKVITWGNNDEGALGRVTESDENPDASDEKVPAYAQGLDDIVIVKVVCGSNITLALSDEGQLYATGTFRINTIFSTNNLHIIALRIIMGKLDLR
ncbi:8969_t:CDS:2 [Gigaspora rosea]|nr:8969_t:CDS:2 [Gigaspora rosea]